MFNRILFVVQNDLMGGAEQLLKSLAEEYDSNGAKVTVVIMRSPMQNNWKNLSSQITVRYLNSKNYWAGIVNLAFFIVPFSLKNKFDCIFSSNININGVLGLLRRIKLLRTKKLIIRETTSVFLRTKGAKKQFHILKYIVGYSGADLIVCQTDIMKQQFLGSLKKSHKWNLLSIQNPIDLKKIKSMGNLESNEIIEKYSPYIVSAGRLIHEKGFDLLIQAFAELKKEHNEYKLLILGEGNKQDELKQQIEKLNLQDSVFLLGHQSNPMQYFKNAELCVVSSRIEGFPNVLLQMLALNNKVVSTSCAGNIENIPLVFTCQPNNTLALQNIMKKALSTKVSESETSKKEVFLELNNFNSYLNEIERHLL